MKLQEKSLPAAINQTSFSTENHELLACHGWQTIIQVIRWPHHLNLIRLMDINSTLFTITVISHIQYIPIVPLQAFIAHLLFSVLTLPDTLHRTQLCTVTLLFKRLFTCLATILKPELRFRYKKITVNSTLSHQPRAVTTIYSYFVQCQWITNHRSSVAQRLQQLNRGQWYWMQSLLMWAL